MDFCKKIKKYFPDKKCCDFPFIVNEDMFTIALSIENISIESFKDQFIRQSILHILDKYWKKFVQVMSKQEENENIIFITDKYLDIKSEIETIIFERLMNAKIPLNHNSDKFTGKKNIKSPNIEVTLNKPIDTCPCGSGKPFAECHGQKLNKKRR